VDKQEHIVIFRYVPLPRTTRIIDPHQYSIHIAPGAMSSVALLLSLPACLPASPNPSFHRLVNSVGMCSPLMVAFLFLQLTFTNCIFGRSSPASRASSKCSSCTCTWVCVFCARARASVCHTSKVPWTQGHIQTGAGRERDTHTKQHGGARYTQRESPGWEIVGQGVGLETQRERERKRAIKRCIESYILTKVYGYA
jgi:hypothetical protein